MPPIGFLDNGIIDPSAGCRLDNLILPVSSAEKFDINDWKELVYGETEWQDDFVENASESVLKLTVDWKRTYGAILFILGLDIVAGDGADARLLRFAPISHPLWPWMRAVGVSVKGVLYSGSTEDVPQSVVKLPLKTARYTKSEITVRFKAAPYVVLTDDQVYAPPSGGGAATTNEWLRFTTVEPRPRPPGLLAADNLRQLKYVEGAAAGDTVSAPFADIKRSCDFEVTWWRVPSTWVSQFWLPSRMLTYLGTLNSAEFMGFPKNTLLWDGISFEPFQYPVKTIQGPAIGYHVKMLWNWFDPNNLVSPSNYRGHQLLPVKKGASVGWLYATGDVPDANAGTAAGVPLYPITKDFAGAFEYVAKP